MGRKEELKALNTPIDGKHYRFVLGDGGFTFAEYDVTLSGLIPIDEQFAWYFTYYTESQYVNDNIQLSINALSTMEDIYDQIIVDDLYATLNGLDYLYVTHLLGVMHVKIRINPYILNSVFGAYFESNPITYGPVTYTGGNYQLKFAPDGWEDDEYQVNRDMQLFGMFSKFTVGELKFVKDGRDYISALYEANGVNANCTITVYETPPSGIERVRFIGKIDFKTYKITELSVDVQVKDSTFTDLVLDRMATDVNMLGLTSIDGTAISAPDSEFLIIPEIKINQVGSWEGIDYTTIHNGSHYIFVDIINSEYTEARKVDQSGELFFVDAQEEYVDANLSLKIQGVLTGSTPNAEFIYNYHISKWVLGVETIIHTGAVNFIGSDPIQIDIDNSETFTIYVGDSLGFRGNITNIADTGTVQYSSVELILATPIETIASRTIRMFLHHEAFDRLIEQYTGNSGRVKSDFFGRTDIGYSVDGVIGCITAGRYIRNIYGLNVTMPASLQKLFKSMQSIYQIGMGSEVVEGVEKIVIEDMSYFFSNKVIINVSDRIAPETIEKEYYPELSFNRIAVGYNSFEYESLGGIYEYNTTSKFTTPIKPVDKELNIVADYRADISGVLKLMTEPEENKDIPGENEIFILDTIRDGSDFLLRTSEGFDQSEDLSNRDTLFNLDITPARNLRRWGSFIRGFAEKYTTASLLWQNSDKNTKLKSTETGESEVIESANVLISDLADPLWHPEIFTLEIPALENDINLINENPYGLIQITDSEYGWILQYRSKNENGKSEFILLRCNTDYVTPNGDPVYPSTVHVRKGVSNAVVDYTVFNFNIIGDNGVQYLKVPISVEGDVILTNVPYGTYTVTEEAELGYTLESIDLPTFTIDRDNLHFDVNIINSKDPVIENIKYGALYNWYAAKDIRGLAASGWEVPYDELWIELINYCGSDVLAYNYLSEAGTLYWNVGSGSNLYNFNARGGGARAYDNGAFTGLKSNGVFVTVTAYGGTNYVVALAVDSSALIGTDGYGKSHGASCRLVKLTTSLAHGETGTYTGNDGKVYRTICIGTQEWLADNLNETKYRNGDIIPVVTDNSAWAALVTGARCSYNNDDSNL